jgi:hypothetical protein
MNGTPMLRQIAHRLMTQQAGTRRDAGELASAAVNVYATLLTSLSPLLGDLGSSALLRRSLKLTEATFPCYTEVRVAEQDGLLNAVGACLRKQSPDVAWDASVAVLTAYIELLATFIGERLTRQLLHEAWPDLHISPTQERQE